MQSTARVCDVSFNSVAKLLEDAGKACEAFHDKAVRGVKAKRVQCDEIWSFVYAKQRNVAEAKSAPEGAGDCWTWTALDADTKLVIAYAVGGRDADYASAFMQDVAERLANRVQMTTDGHKAYLEAVEGAFGADIDYAMLVKTYGEGPASPGRYSPGVCVGAEQRRVEGRPDPVHVSTS
jgi:IS1 family transposase